MEDSSSNLVIIGAGPAGLSAGIYSARAGIKTIIIEKGIPGGLAATTDLIENYPGFPDGISGMVLGELMAKQCRRFGVEFVTAEVSTVSKEADQIVIAASTGEIRTAAAIVATGSLPKKLDIPGEKEFYGRGVTYCATCDGPLFRNQDVIIVGCGNSGLQEGRYLLGIARSVTFVEFLPYITADKILADQIKRDPKARFLLNHMVVSIIGKDRVDCITIRDRETNAQKTIPATGVFIYAGLLPNTGFLQGFLELDKSGFIITNELFETSAMGVYAAGDARAKQVRQVVVACSEGAVAAINAYHYLENR